MKVVFSTVTNTVLELKFTKMEAATSETSAKANQMASANSLATMAVSMRAILAKERSTVVENGSSH